MRILLAAFALLGITCVVGAAQPADGNRRRQPADAAELAEIAARGRALAAYDQVAWHSTDAVQALHPDDAELGPYLVRKTEHGWVGGFGRLDAAKTHFLLAYEVTGDEANHAQVKHNVPAVSDDGEWLQIARAFETVKPLIPPGNQIYNTAILPAGDGRWFAYLYPAQTVTGTFPAGGDTRYTISQDGTKVEATRKMHASILEFGTAGIPKDAKDVGTFRTEYLDDAPEDTDVAMVLMMGGVPMTVATTNFTYKIDAQGMPTFWLPTAEFKKLMKKKH